MAKSPVKLTLKDLKEKLDENDLDLSMLQLTTIPVKEIVSSICRVFRCFNSKLRTV